DGIRDLTVTGVQTCALPISIPDEEEGKVVLWSRSSREAVRLQVTPSRTERQRHVRKYAEGELPPERSFYFRGPKEARNLRAQNRSEERRVGKEWRARWAAVE